jgi:hypothetical protein
MTQPSHLNIEPIQELTTTEVEAALADENARNGELFEHLSYLSMLHRNTMHQQEIDGEGPEDYKV